MQKKRKRKIRFSKKKKFNRVFLIVILFFLIIFSRIIISQTIKLRELKGQLSQKMKENEDIKKEIDELKYDIQNKDSLEFIEKVARNKLGMIKKEDLEFKKVKVVRGEIVQRLIQKDEKPKNNEETKENNKKNTEEKQKEQKKKSN